VLLTHWKQRGTIIAAYQHLDSERGEALAAALGIEPENLKKETDRDALEAIRQDFRNKDAGGDDYEIQVS
jgi:hypothetical protein